MHNDLRYFPAPWLEVVAEDPTMDSIARAFSNELKSFDISTHFDENMILIEKHNDKKHTI